MSSTTTKVITPTVVLSYPHLDQPQKAEDGKKPKYGAAFVVPTGSDMKALTAAAYAAAEEKWPGKGAAMLKAAIDNPGTTPFRSPFRRDVEDKGYGTAAEFLCFINARSEQAPGCVYRHADPNDKSEKPKPETIPQDKIKDVLYAGALVRASLRAFGYDNSGNKGVSFALNNVQKMGEGKRLDNRTAAEDEFDADLSSAPASIEAFL